MATFRNESFQRLVEGALKQTASTLEEAGIDFCLIGSLSAWVRGGPESSHDLDIGIKAEDQIAAAEALEAAGYTIEVPPETWLFKAWTGKPKAEGSIMVDFIYGPSGMSISDEVLARADWMDVLAHKMRVLAATDLMTMKLLSLREQHLNYTSTIGTARAIREQIDWAVLRKRTAWSPYAAAFFVMCEGLHICPKKGEEEVVSTALSKIQNTLGSHGADQRAELVKRYGRDKFFGHSNPA